MTAGYLDNDLINDFKNGLPKAYDELYNRYFTMIFAFCCSLIENKQESQDLAMETMNKLFLKHRDFETLTNIKAFLYITARNRCLDYLRYMQRTSIVKNNIKNALTEADEDNDLLDAEYLYTIRQSIEGLPPRQKQAIELLYLSGEKFKYTEVAEKMKVSVKTVENLRQLGLACLREIIHSNKTTEAVGLLGLLLTILN